MLTSKKSSPGSPPSSGGDIPSFFGHSRLSNGYNTTADKMLKRCCSFLMEAEGHWKQHREAKRAARGHMGLYFCSGATCSKTGSRAMSKTQKLPDGENLLLGCPRAPQPLLQIPSGILHDPKQKRAFCSGCSESYRAPRRTRQPLPAPWGTQPTLCLFYQITLDIGGTTGNQSKN